MLGAFLAQDLALFVDLLRPDADPVLLLSASRGAWARTASARVLKMVIYTFVGSLLMLAR